MKYVDYSFGKYGKRVKKRIFLKREKEFLREQCFGLVDDEYVFKKQVKKANWRELNDILHEDYLENTLPNIATGLG